MAVRYDILFVRFHCMWFFYIIYYIFRFDNLLDPMQYQSKWLQIFRNYLKEILVKTSLKVTQSASYTEFSGDPAYYTGVYGILIPMHTI